MWMAGSVVAGDAIPATNLPPIIPLSAPVTVGVSLDKADPKMDQEVARDTWVVEDKNVAALAPWLPARASALAIKSRELLVFNPTPDQSLAPVAAYGATALWLMGCSNHIYRATITSDAGMLGEEALRSFDAVVLNNVSGNYFGSGDAGEKRVSALLSFVKSGKGVAGIHHAALVPNWQATPANPIESEYRLMLGGVFEKTACFADALGLKVEDPLNPICGVFESREHYSLRCKEEIFQFKTPYSRDHLRVLASADLKNVSHQGNRPDNDYPVAWIKSFDQGRVFFFGLGRNPETFNDPNLLRLLQDGLQYVLGDLPANDVPQ